MIFEIFIDMIFTVITGALDLVPSIPQFPEYMDSIKTTFMTWVADTSEWLDFLLGIDFMTFAIPLLLGVLYFEQAYHITMWLIRKLPFSIQ